MGNETKDCVIIEGRGNAEYHALAASILSYPI